MTDTEIYDFMDVVMVRACMSAESQGFKGKTHTDEVALYGFLRAYVDGCVRLRLARGAE